ncbi:hypothetical protein GCM10009563_23990 [Subtercola frigoramans]
MSPSSSGANVVSLPFATTSNAIALGEAGNYLILANMAITVVGGASHLTGGLVGGNVGAAMTNIPGDVVLGTPAQNLQARSDAIAAYNAATAAGPATLVAAELGGQTLAPGVYHQTAALGLTGVLTLDGGGDANAVWIIQSGGALTTAAASSVKLVGGAQASNVFWVTVGAVTIGGVAGFVGTALSGAAITVGEGANVVGRLLTTTADVTISNVTQSAP